jgi:hypothetical protein
MAAIQIMAVDARELSAWRDIAPDSDQALTLKCLDAL